MCMCNCVSNNILQFRVFLLSHLQYLRNRWNYDNNIFFPQKQLYDLQRGAEERERRGKERLKNRETERIHKRHIIARALAK